MKVEYGYKVIRPADAPLISSGKPRSWLTKFLVAVSCGFLYWPTS